VSNGYVLVATESVYDTAPASGYRELPVTADGHKTRQDVLSTPTIRPAASAPSMLDMTLINKGATGSLSTLGYANGLGILLRAAATTAASEELVPGGDAYEQVFTWGAGGPPIGRSLTTEIYRDRRNGTLDAFTYTGGKVTELQVTQSNDGHLALVFGMDYAKATLTTPTPSRTPTAIVPDWTYSWRDAQITLTPDGGSPATECVDSFGLTLGNALDVEEWCIKRGTGRHEPTRSQTPEPTGTINWRYQSPTYYSAFVAGTVFSLEADWQGPVAIEGSTYPSLTIEIPAIRFTGEDPELQVSGSTMQNLPFAVLDNGTDPACTITYVTSDTTF